MTYNAGMTVSNNWENLEWKWAGTPIDEIDQVLINVKDVGERWFKVENIDRRVTYSDHGQEYTAVSRNYRIWIDDYIAGFKIPVDFYSSGIYKKVVWLSYK